MTEKELEKEAEEYAKENYCDEVRATARNAYLDAIRNREKRIVELEEENERLHKINSEGLSELNHQNGKLIIELAKLEKENQELKEQYAKECEDVCYVVTNYTKQLTKAKEIINAFLDFEAVAMEKGCYIANDIRRKAEDFIKE